MPPYFSPQDFEALKKFVQQNLPPDFKVSLELRQADWFRDENLEPVLALLHKQQLGTVLTDVAGRRDVLHMRLSNKTAMLRFVGNDDPKSDQARVEAWVERFALWISQGLERLYFFAHQPNNDTSPELCRFFCKCMNKRLGLNLAIPKRYHISQQGSLF